MRRHLGGFGRRVVVGVGQQVKDAARAALRTKRSGLVGQHFSQAAQQRGAAFQTDQRVAGLHLERLAEPVGDDTTQPGCIDLQRVGRVAGEHACGEGVEAGHTQAFGTGEGLAAGRLHIFPVGPGTGVEQHTHQRQVDLRTGTGGCADIAQAGVEQGAAVDAARFKMPPAAVVRDRAVGVTGLGHLGHHGGGVVECVVVHGEMARRPVTGLGQQAVCTFADAVCRA